MKTRLYVFALSVAAVGLILIGAIYFMWSRNIKDNEHLRPNPAVSGGGREAVSLKSRYSRFVDGETGLSLSYPSVLGELVVREQGARCEAAEGGACRRAVLEFPEALNEGVPTRIAAISIGANPLPLSGGGASVADEARQVRSDSDLAALSEGRGCKLGLNPHGIKFVRCPTEKTAALGDAPDMGSIWYIALPEAGPAGVVVFSEDLERVFGSSEANAILEYIVDRIEF